MMQSQNTLLWTWRPSQLFGPLHIFGTSFMVILLPYTQTTLQLLSSSKEQTSQDNQPDANSKSNSISQQLSIFLEKSTLLPMPYLSMSQSLQLLIFLISLFLSFIQLIAKTLCGLRSSMPQNLVKILLQQNYSYLFWLLHYRMMFFVALYPQRTLRSSNQSFLAALWRLFYSFSKILFQQAILVMTGPYLQSTLNTIVPPCILTLRSTSLSVFLMLKLKVPQKQFLYQNTHYLRQCCPNIFTYCTLQYLLLLLHTPPAHHG